MEFRPSRLLVKFQPYAARDHCAVALQDIPGKSPRPRSRRGGARPVPPPFVYLLPIAWATTVPASTLTGRVSPLIGLGAAAVGATAFLLARLLWRIALKRYTGASGLKNQGRAHLSRLLTCSTTARVAASKSGA